MNKEMILQAVARGWCDPATSGKVMDSTLAEAIANEVHRVVDYEVAMLLAAISTASGQNTRESAKERIGRDSPYWTQAYGDVCVAIDREMALRERGEATRDGDRWLFLVRHWSSMYKGKPLHRFLEEDSLLVGGIEACLDEAMAAAHPSRLLQRTALPCGKGPNDSCDTPCCLEQERGTSKREGST